jgi:hypothetical protein
MDHTDPARDLDPLRNLGEAADHAQMLVEAQQLAAEVFGAEGAELAAGLTWTAVGTGQATAAIHEHVLVNHRTPILWTRARAATARSGSWWPTSDGPATLVPKARAQTLPCFAATVASTA